MAYRDVITHHQSHAQRTAFGSITHFRDDGLGGVGWGSYTYQGFFFLSGLILGNKGAFNDGSSVVLVFTGVQILIPLLLTFTRTHLFFTSSNFTTASRGRFYCGKNEIVVDDCPDYITVG